MSTATERAYSYLAAPVGAAWTWSADGKVVTWTTGEKKTIAFKQEIEAIINRLAPHGLPVFEAVVIFLAAWRDDHWQQHAPELGQAADPLLKPAHHNLRRLARAGRPICAREAKRAC